MFLIVNASLNSGAISLSENPAIPQPILVTRNLNSEWALAKLTNSSTFILFQQNGERDYQSEAAHTTPR